MTIVPPTELRPENRRRSKRVKVRVPVVVRFQTADKRSISEKTHTIIVNDHGALILLAATVEIQQDYPPRKRSFGGGTTLPESPA